MSQQWRILKQQFQLSVKSISLTWGRIPALSLTKHKISDRFLFSKFQFSHLKIKIMPIMRLVILYYCTVCFPITHSITTGNMSAAANLFDWSPLDCRTTALSMYTKYLACWQRRHSKGMNEWMDGKKSTDHKAYISHLFLLSMPVFCFARINMLRLLKLGTKTVREKCLIILCNYLIHNKFIFLREF